MTNEQILDRYLYAFNSTPSYEMFMLMGGLLPKRYFISGYPCYTKYVGDLGYDAPIRQVYRVYLVRLENKKLVYIGGAIDIGERLGVNAAAIRNANKNGNLVKQRYSIEMIDVNSEYRNLYRKDLYKMEEYKY